MYFPKTATAYRRHVFLSPYIWEVIIKKLGEGEHKLKPQDFLVLVNAELEKNGHQPTNVQSVGHILSKGTYKWFVKENYNRYKFRVLKHNLPRITEDLLEPSVIKDLPIEYRSIISI